MVSKILVVKRSALPGEWLPVSGVVRMVWKELESGLSGITPEFRARTEMEKDPSFKQLIPYVLVRDADGRIAGYPRKGDEARLHGLWSMGIGGHVDPGDYAVEGIGWRQILEYSLRRELREELPGAEGVVNLMGLVNDETSPVGRVHLGVIVCLELAEGCEVKPGAELPELRWLEPAAWASLPAGQELEGWSTLALSLLGG